MVSSLFSPQRHDDRHVYSENVIDQQPRNHVHDLQQSWLGIVRWKFDIDNRYLPSIMQSEDLYRAYQKTE